MKKTTKSVNGTSFHGVTIIATVTDLTAVCGQPDFGENQGSDKVNFEWVMETSTGEVFTIYDWKEYRSLKDNEDIEWHIGGHEKTDTLNAYKEVATALLNKKTKKAEV